MFIRAKTILLGKTKEGRSPIYPGNIVEVDDEAGREFISLEAAVEVKNTPVATATVPPDDEDPNGTIPSDEGGGNGLGDGENEKDDLTDDEDIPVFSTDMKADELRAAMRNRGLSIRVGMTKAEMVEILNGASEEPPEIAPQDVVEE